MDKEDASYIYIYIYIYVYTHTHTHTHKGLLAMKKKRMRGFAGVAVVTNPPANAGDMGSSPGPGRSHMPRSS